MTPRIALVLAAATTLASLCSGCGKANPDGPALDAANKHPANWIVAHRAAYQANQNQCRSCHGDDLKGGITRIDCFNQGSDTRCHAGGHGPRAIIHSVPFADPKLHGAMARKDLVICQDCHGTAGGPGSNPRFTVRIGSLVTGCEASGCHTIGMAHPKPWANHRLAGNQANACALCHGATFGGGSGPACSSCHKELKAGQLPTASSCTSCHGYPPTGTVTPNRAGSHAKHLALPEVAGNCAICHLGGGSGSTSHTTRLTVAFPAAYNAKSGTVAYNGTARTCANVKCHGGQTTPSWYGGAINSAVACNSCHTAGSTQYNSYVSGQHTRHIGLNLACTDCHDMGATTLPHHFSNLSSTLFNRPAAATIRSYIRYTPPSCSPQSPVPAGNQITGCHGVEQWQ